MECECCRNPYERGNLYLLLFLKSALHSLFSLSLTRVFQLVVVAQDFADVLVVRFNLPEEEEEEEETCHLRAQWGVSYFAALTWA